YKRKNVEVENQVKQFGLIAQEVEEVFPELVRSGLNGMKSIDYNGLIPVLVEAIKEQQKQISKLLNR
ncbi:MAG: tail fiber domain-containing protein, partial [bacterium]